MCAFPDMPGACRRPMGKAAGGAHAVRLWGGVCHHVRHQPPVGHQNQAADTAHEDPDQEPGEGGLAAVHGDPQRLPPHISRGGIPGTIQVNK